MKDTVIIMGNNKEDFTHENDLLQIIDARLENVKTIYKFQGIK